MVKFSNKRLVGIGLSSRDLRALRAGCSCKVYFEEYDIDVCLVACEDDCDLTGFRITLDKNPEVVPSECIWT